MNEQQIYNALKNINLYNSEDQNQDLGDTNIPKEDELNTEDNWLSNIKSSSGALKNKYSDKTGSANLKNSASNRPENVDISHNQELDDTKPDDANKSDSSWKSYMKTSTQELKDKYNKKAETTKGGSKKKKIDSVEKMLQRNRAKDFLPGIVKVPLMAGLQTAAGALDNFDLALLPTNILGDIAKKDNEWSSFGLGDKLKSGVEALAGGFLTPSNDFEEDITTPFRMVGAMFGGGGLFKALTKSKQIANTANLISNTVQKLGTVDGVRKYPEKVLKIYANLLGSVFQNPTLSQAGIGAAAAYAGEKLKEEVGNETWLARALPILTTFGTNILGNIALNKGKQKVTNLIDENQYKKSQAAQLPHHTAMLFDPNNPYSRDVTTLMSNMMDSPGVSASSVKRFNEIESALNKKMNLNDKPSLDYDESARALKSTVDATREKSNTVVDALKKAIGIEDSPVRDNVKAGQTVKDIISKKNAEMAKKSKKLKAEIMPDKKNVKPIESFKDKFHKDTTTSKLSADLDNEAYEKLIKDYIKEVPHGFQHIKEAPNEAARNKILDDFVQKKSSAKNSKSDNSETYNFDFYDEKNKYSHVVKVNKRGNEEYGYLVPEKTMKAIQEVAKYEDVPTSVKSFIHKLKENNGIISSEDMDMARKIFNTKDNQTGVKFSTSSLRKLQEAASEDLTDYFKRVKHIHPNADKKFKQYNELWKHHFDDVTREKAVNLWKASNQKENVNWDTYRKDIGGINEDNIINKHYISKASPEQIKTVLTELIKDKGIDPTTGKFKASNVIKFFNSKDKETLATLQSMFDKAKIPLDINEYRIKGGEAISELKSLVAGKHSLYGDVNKPQKQYFTEFKNFLTSDPQKANAIIDKLKPDQSKKLLTDVLEFVSYPSSQAADKGRRNFAKLNEFLHSMTKEQQDNFQKMWNKTFPDSKTTFNDIKSFLDSMQRIANRSNKSGTSHHGFIRDFSMRTAPEAAIDVVNTVVTGKLPSLKTRLFTYLMYATFANKANKQLLLNPDFVDWGLKVRHAKTKPEALKLLLKGIDDKYIILPTAVGIKNVIQKELDKEED